MTTSQRPLRLVLSLLLWALPAAAVAETYVYQSRGAVPMAIFEVDGRPILRRTDGSERPLEIAEGAGVSVVEGLAGGWIVVGKRALGEEIDLYLLRSRGGRLEELPTPPGKFALLRGQPRLLVERGKIAGLLWLEGTEQADLSVLAAEWQGDRWSEPEVISGVGPGAKAALEAVILDDGSWLAVWSGDDEQRDAETWWSRRVDGRWSPPARLHEDNQVPDIHPAVAAVDGGALVVWSVFAPDRQYRLRQARFQDGRWSLSELFGEPGSHDLRFVLHDGIPHLTYRGGWPMAWRVRTFDRAGRETGRAALATENALRPFIDLSQPGGPRAVWPGSERRPETVERAMPWEPDS